MYDPDGKIVYHHKSARENKYFQAAWALYLKTDMGRANFERLNRPDVIVVFTVGSNPNYAGYVQGPFKTSTPSHEIRDPKNYYGLESESFPSSGQPLYTVILDAEILREKPVTYSATTVWHEGEAHVVYMIDGIAVDSKDAHKKLGHVVENYQSKPWKAKKNSPTGRFWEEVTKAQEGDPQKSDRGDSPGNMRHIHSQQTHNFRRYGDQ